MASNLRVDTILPSSGTTLGIGTASGTINFLGNSNLTTTGDVTVGGNLGVGGTLTYEDVTNIDSVGVITARTDINIGDSIIHIGDTNTKIRFPAADTITAETGGSERVRITSGGSVLVGKTNTSLTTDGIRMDSNAAMITASSTSTNQATANGGSLYLINSSATDNNFSHIGGYNSNGLVTSQINFVNTSHSSRTGDISFRTHDGSSMPERMRISSQGYVTKPNTPAFNVKGGNMTRTDASGYICQFNNTTGTGCFDNGGNFNTSTYKFIAPVTGTYYFFTNIRLDSFSSGYIRTGFLSTNYGTSQFWTKPETGHVISYYNTPNNIKHISTSTIMQLDVNDEVYVYQDPNSDTSFTCYLNESSFGGYLIG